MTTADGSRLSDLGKVHLRVKVDCQEKKTAFHSGQSHQKGHPWDRLPVEDKEDQEEQKRTSGEGIAWKVTKRKPLSEELQRVCEATPFDLTREELWQMYQLLQKRRDVLQLKEDQWIVELSWIYFATFQNIQITVYMRVKQVQSVMVERSSGQKDWNQKGVPPLMTINWIICAALGFTLLFTFLLGEKLMPIISSS